MLHLDFETRSTVDLKKAGAYKYAKHPDTKLLSACWAVDDGDVHPHTFDPEAPPAAPQALIDALAEADEVWAHNAAFERLILKYVGPRYGLPLPARFKCTAVLCRSLGLPSSLGDAARCIGLDYQKDKAGEALIRQMSIPPYEWTHILADRMTAYCAQDVAVERAIHGWLPDHVNWEAYWVSERINDTGVMIDVEFAEHAAAMLEQEKAAIKRKFADLVPFTSPASIKFTRWVAEQLEDAFLRDMRDWMDTVRYKDGERKKGLTLGKDIVEALLERHDLPDHLRRPLELKQEYSRSSASKFATMVARAEEDDRVRGAFVFLGAAKTGRFASRGLQLHNMPRDAVDDPLAYIDGDLPLTLDVLPALIRPTLMPAEGCQFACADWAGIEARALPWLADASSRNRRVRQLMAMFEAGEDIYVDEARNIYGDVEIDKGKRQVGKVAVLSLGYGGSVGAFRAMAKNYGVVVTDAEAMKIVKAWRTANGWATAFWRQLMAAALMAVQAGGVRQAGRVFFEKRGTVLYCRLPSGRELAYPDIRIEAPEKKWMGPQLSSIKASLKPPADDPDAPWLRERLWGGLMAENVTQAVCADILLHALVRLDDIQPNSIVAHTHDEILLEGGETGVMQDVMTTPPTWAEGLPLAVETWTGEYYRK